LAFYRKKYFDVDKAHALISEIYSFSCDLSAISPPNDTLCWYQHRYRFALISFISPLPLPLPVPTPALAPFSFFDLNIKI
jgi:hypothetical protein